MNRSHVIRLAGVLASFVLVATPLRPLLAGNVFVTGHDPDFHGVLGGNASGAQNIISRGLDFARNGNTAPILYIQTSTVNNGLGDHTDSEAVLPLVGYTPGNTAGNHYVKVDATQFATATLASYSAIFIPSDHGGSLTGDDLAALECSRRRHSVLRQLRWRNLGSQRRRLPHARLGRPAADEFRLSAVRRVCRLSESGRKRIHGDTLRQQPRPDGEPTLMATSRTRFSRRSARSRSSTRTHPAR